MSKDDDNLPNPESIAGKILSGADGAGTPTQEDVNRRAREIAAEEGMDTKNVDARYVAQAHEELTGATVPADDVLPEADELEERDEVIGESGRHVPNVGLADEVSAGETLVNQGLDEAVSDEMREGARKLDRENRGLEPDGD